MKTHHRFVRALLLSVLMGMLMASAALAKNGGLGFARLSASGTVSVTGPCPSPSPSPSPSPDPSLSPTPSPSESSSDDQGTSDHQESDDQGDQGTSDDQEGADCQEPDQGKTTQTSGNSADRAKACMDAAGMSTNPPAGGTQTKTTGLDHAIERVMANCIKNPQAPGLLNALGHLVANRDRHVAHEAEQAARKAAHDAAKAAREASKGSKGHGHSSGD